MARIIFDNAFIIKSTLVSAMRSLPPLKEVNMGRMKKIYVITSLAGFALGIYLSTKMKDDKKPDDDVVILEDDFTENKIHSLKDKLQNLLTKLKKSKIKKSTISLLENIDDKLTELINSMSN